MKKRLISDGFRTRLICFPLHWITELCFITVFRREVLEASHDIVVLLVSEVLDDFIVDFSLESCVAIRSNKAAFHARLDGVNQFSQHGSMVCMLMDLALVLGNIVVDENGDSIVVNHISDELLQLRNDGSSLLRETRHLITQMRDKRVYFVHNKNVLLIWNNFHLHNGIDLTSDCVPTIFVAQIFVVIQLQLA